MKTKGVLNAKLGTDYEPIKRANYIHIIKKKCKLCKLLFNVCDCPNKHKNNRINQAFFQHMKIQSSYHRPSSTIDHQKPPSTTAAPMPASDAETAAKKKQKKEKIAKNIQDAMNGIETPTKLIESEAAQMKMQEFMNGSNTPNAAQMSRVYINKFRAGILTCVNVL